MQVSFVVEEKGGSNVVVKVTVSKEETKKAYKERLLDIQKNASLNGFRKGKVPTSIIESKFKESILAECSTSIMDESFKEVYDKLEDGKKPAHFSRPSITEASKPSLDEDITYEVSYDVVPVIKYGDFKEVKITEDDVKVSDSDMNKEIELLLQDFTTIEIKDDAADKNDIVLVNYTVQDETGAEIDKKENEHINIAKNYDYYKIGSDLIGHKKGDEFKFKKSYKKDDIESLAGKKLSFDVKVIEVKREVVPELTDEFVKTMDEAYQSVEDLKKKTKENLDKMALDMKKERTLQKAMDNLIETFVGDIPESMIEHSKDNHIEEVKSRFGGDKGFKQFLASKKESEEDYKKEITEDIIKSIKSSLILGDIVKNNKFEISEEEMKDHLKNYAKYYRMDVEKLFESLKNMNGLPKIEEEVKTKKALDLIYDNIKKEKGKTYSLEEYAKLDVKND